MNTELLFGWCLYTHLVPVTLRNLDYAFRDLSAKGQLKQRADYEDQVVIHIAQEFAAEHPEMEPYFYRVNFDKEEAYRNRHSIPLSVDGLFQAFTQCIEQRLISPGDTGFISGKNAVWIRQAISPEDRKKLKDNPQASDAARKRQDAKLKSAFQQSLKGGPTQERNYAEKLRDGG
jgi:hypothetical protein